MLPRKLPGNSAHCLALCYALRAWMLILAVLFAGVVTHPARADTLPETAYIEGVVGHAQSSSLSCEARSAVDWAAFWGVSISETEFQAGLPLSDNPETGFVGYPYDAWGYVPPASYGVHAEPVAALLRQYGLQTDARRDLTWDDLRAEIAAGRPAIVWVIGQMWVGAPVQYTASDGQTVTVANFEHTMILIGYDPKLVHVVDAYSGWTYSFSLKSFLRSWEVLGKMAILGSNPSGRSTAENQGNTYTVQRGDYLSALAARFDTTWQELAALNGIAYPYTIYPGQLLTLPGAKAASTPAQMAKEVGLHTILLPLLLKSDGGKSQAAVDAKPVEERPSTYVVQRGDFLIALALRFDLDWRELARTNGISFP